MESAQLWIEVQRTLIVWQGIMPWILKKKTSKLNFFHYLICNNGINMYNIFPSACKCFQCKKKNMNLMHCRCFTSLSNLYNWKHLKSRKIFHQAECVRQLAPLCTIFKLCCIYFANHFKYVLLCTIIFFGTLSKHGLQFNWEMAEFFLSCDFWLQLRFHRICSEQFTFGELIFSKYHDFKLKFTFSQ